MSTNPNTALATLPEPKSMLPTPTEWATIKEQVSMYVQSGFLPQGVNTPQKAVTIAMKGWELGIPPMQAFSHIAVINGKPTISAELMLAMIYTKVPGAVVNILRTDDEGCEIEARRPGAHTKFSKFSFLKHDAIAAGKLDANGVPVPGSSGKPTPWQTYPGAMYRARAISAMARAMFPDALMGCSYTPEEIGVDVAVDDEGHVAIQGQTVEATSRRVDAQAPRPAAAASKPAPAPTPKPLPGDVKITIGPFAGKRMREIELSKLEAYRDHYGTAERTKLSPQQIRQLDEMLWSIDEYTETVHAGQVASTPTAPADNEPKDEKDLNPNA